MRIYNGLRNESRLFIRKRQMAPNGGQWVATGGHEGQRAT
jgi:hypothetical protein